jgi:hypothetical protein
VTGPDRLRHKGDQMSNDEPAPPTQGLPMSPTARSRAADGWVPPAPPPPRGGWAPPATAATLSRTRPRMCRSRATPTGRRRRARCELTYQPGLGAVSVLPRRGRTAGTGAPSSSPGSGGPSTAPTWRCGACCWHVRPLRWQHGVGHRLRRQRQPLGLARASPGPSVEQFRAAQHKWAVAALVVFVVGDRSCRLVVVIVVVAERHASAASATVHDQAPAALATRSRAAD